MKLATLIALFATVDADEGRTQTTNYKKEVWQQCDAGHEDEGCGNGLKCAYEGVRLRDTAAKSPPVKRVKDWPQGKLEDIAYGTKDRISNADIFQNGAWCFQRDWTKVVLLNNMEVEAKPAMECRLWANCAAPGCPAGPAQIPQNYFGRTYNANSGGSTTRVACKQEECQIRPQDTETDKFEWFSNYNTEVRWRGPVTIKITRDFQDIPKNNLGNVRRLDGMLGETITSEGMNPTQKPLLTEKVYTTEDLYFDINYHVVEAYALSPEFREYAAKYYVDPRVQELNRLRNKHSPDHHSHLVDGEQLVHDHDDDHDHVYTKSQPGYCIQEDTCGDDNLEEIEMICGAAKLGVGMIASIALSFAL